MGGNAGKGVQRRGRELALRVRTCLQNSWPIWRAEHAARGKRRASGRRLAIASELPATAHFVCATRGCRQASASQYGDGSPGPATCSSGRTAETRLRVEPAYEARAWLPHWPTYSGRRKTVDGSAPRGGGEGDVRAGVAGRLRCRLTCSVIICSGGRSQHARSGRKTRRTSRGMQAGQQKACSPQRLTLEHRVRETRFVFCNTRHGQSRGRPSHQKYCGTIWISTVQKSPTTDAHHHGLARALPLSPPRVSSAPRRARNVRRSRPQPGRLSRATSQALSPNACGATAQAPDATAGSR